MLYISIYIYATSFEKKNLKEKFYLFLAYNTPQALMSAHKKFQPNLFSHLDGYRQHIYTNVLFYSYPLIEPRVNEPNVFLT